MNPALLKLIGLQTRGFVRRMVRGASSPRRAAFLALGIALILLWLGPALLTGIAGRKLTVGGHNRSELTRTFAPLMLLGICLLTIISSAGDKAISFTPGEVDILFAGPFSRRQLLAYKLGKSGLAALLTSLIFSIALLANAGTWIGCYAGVLLGLLFIQFFSTAGVLLGQAVSQRAYTLGRRVVLVAVTLLVAVLVRQSVISRGSAGALYELRYSEIGQKVLAPFVPFGEAIAAETSSEVARWTLEALAIDAALLVLVLYLDTNYIEAALSASRRRYAQLQRIRSGSLLPAGVKGQVKWHLPRLPWAGGAGPVAWRQATSAARSARGLLLLLLICALGAGPMLTAARAVPEADISGPLIGILAWLTVLLSGMLKFDFRGDLDHMDELKALPLRPVALAVGQIVVPTCILTAAHVLLLGSVSFVVHEHRDVLLIAACLALPFNALLMATENLIFLLFPTRPAAASPGDFQVLGRQAAQLVMKAFTVLSGCMVAFGIAALVLLATGGGLVVLAIVAGVILAGETLALVPMIAWAYNRFDPSVDTPA